MVIALGLLSTSFSLRPHFPVQSRSEPLNNNLEDEEQVEHVCRSTNSHVVLS
jgi:hypothetical protein